MPVNNNLMQDELEPWVRVLLFLIVHNNNNKIATQKNARPGITSFERQREVISEVLYRVIAQIHCIMINVNITTNINVLIAL